MSKKIDVIIIVVFLKSKFLKNKISPNGIKIKKDGIRDHPKYFDKLKTPSKINSE